MDNATPRIFILGSDLWIIRRSYGESGICRVLRFGRETRKGGVFIDLAGWKHPETSAVIYTWAPPVAPPQLTNEILEFLIKKKGRNNPNLMLLIFFHKKYLIFKYFYIDFLNKILFFFKKKITRVLL